MDSKAFKDGMRRLAASVCLITTARDDGERFGLTATAVCSLSADPPMLLCCLNRGSHSFQAVSEAGRFCVNVLSLEDAAVAHHFSGDRSAAEKFTAGTWRTGVTGAPVLASALAAFDCRLIQAIEAGTHAIMIGEVQEVALLPDERRPLLYAEGGYGRFTAQDAEATLAAS
jgi:flavin reductase (DIM6/NTAB) family NADH-FMN oxidoreductase RutF